MRGSYGRQDDFDPVEYWNAVTIGREVDAVEEVGHPDMGREFNRLAYQLRLGALLRAIEPLDLSPRTAVFEAGFGVGFYLALWNEMQCDRVVGVDLSAAAHRHAQLRFPRFDLRLDDVARIDEWPDWDQLRSSFDLVTALDVLFHIIDDDAAKRALGALAAMVTPGARLVVTEKFPDPRGRVRETRNVVRRPLEWYVGAVEPLGLTLERTSPVFWCMDPPVFYSRRFWPAAVPARLVWIAMRAAVKFWPRNGTLQTTFARFVGGIGRRLDEEVVARFSATPNLMIATFRRA